MYFLCKISYIKNKLELYKILILYKNRLESVPESENNMIYCMLFQHFAESTFASGSLV